MSHAPYNTKNRLSIKKKTKFQEISKYLQNQRGMKWDSFNFKTDI